MDIREIIVEAMQGDVRTKETIKASIVHELANKPSISGNHDFNVGLQMILKQSMVDERFNEDAL